MRLHAKVIATTQQRPTTMWASTSAVGACPGTMLFKFVMNEDHQAALPRHKGLARIELGLDKDLTPTQQACKSELWPLFEEAKAIGKRAFWRATELFINNTQICSPPLLRRVGTKETYVWYYGTCTGEV